MLERKARISVDTDIEKGRTVFEIMQHSIDVIQSLASFPCGDGNSITEARRELCLFHLSRFDRCAEILREDKKHIEENLEKLIGSMREELEKLVRKIDQP